MNYGFHSEEGIGSGADCDPSAMLIIPNVQRVASTRTGDKDSEPIPTREPLNGSSQGAFIIHHLWVAPTRPRPSDDTWGGLAYRYGTRKKPRTQPAVGPSVPLVVIFRS